MSRIATTRKLTERRALRKQNELLPQQDSKLKMLAHPQGMTEAELIRQTVAAFPQQSLPTGGQPLPADQATWQEILAAFAASHKGSVTSAPPR